MSWAVVALALCGFAPKAFAPEHEILGRREAPIQKDYCRFDCTPTPAYDSLQQSGPEWVQAADLNGCASRATLAYASTHALVGHGDTNHSRPTIAYSFSPIPMEQGAVWVRPPEPGLWSYSIGLDSNRGQIPAPKFIELADPEFTEITADAIVKLPPLDSHERAMLGRLLQLIPLGPAEYSHGDIMAITGGRVIRCEAMADHLAIEVPAFKEDLAGAISVLAEVLRNARLDDSESGSAGTDADPWTSILHGPYTASDGLRLHKGELEEFYHHIFRPESVTVAVSGPFPADAAQKAWDQKMADWVVPRTLRPLPAPDPLPRTDPIIGAIELDGPEIQPDSPDISSSLLSLFALGCGKGGSLFRLAREEDALSYRQEAILWPTAGGWLPRLVVASADLKNAESAGEKLKKQLLADVSAWTETDRLRAAGLAEGVLLRGVPLSPFYFRPDRPVTGAAADRAYLEAYWLSKTGLPWNPAGLVDGMKGVSLEALKSSATTLLTNSRLVIQTAKKG